jgi:hypothetical protein
VSQREGCRIEYMWVPPTSHEYPSMGGTHDYETGSLKTVVASGGAKGTSQS